MADDLKDYSAERDYPTAIRLLITNIKNPLIYEYLC